MNSVVGTAAEGFVSVPDTGPAHAEDVGGVASESYTSTSGIELVPVIGGSAGLSTPLSSISLS